jgi:hypothetical protein
LFWWLFLHRRLRSGNEVQLSLNDLGPSLGGSSPRDCCSFLFEQLKKVSQLSLAEPFGSDSGVIRNLTVRLFSSLAGVTAPLADPFVGLEGRNLRDTRFIRLCIFQIKFSCVLFLQKKLFRVISEIGK